MDNSNIMKGHDEYFDVYFLIKRGKNKIFCDVYDFASEEALPVPDHKYKVYDTLFDAYHKVKFN